MGKVYSVFLNGKFWGFCLTKANADREKSTLKKAFPKAKVTVMKTEAPRYL